MFIVWNAASVISSRLDPAVPESKLIAEWLEQIAPSDPQTHYAVAFLLENTFDPDDQIRSLREYEAATALSPHHFMMWLNLAQARDRSGDSAGAETAFAQASTLAPNYAAVDWAYGNSLVRHAKFEDGFRLMAKAAASDPQYANPAVFLAWQLFEGDIGEIRRVLGDSTGTNAALTDVLASKKLYDGAFEAWSKLPAEDKRTKFKATGERLLVIANDAQKLQIAALIYNDLIDKEAEKLVIGQLANGGFENGVKLRNAGIFEWQIGAGVEPKISLNEIVKRSGRYSLLMAFDSFDPAAFRPVSQRVAVSPATTYEFVSFYRADLKTTAAFKWEILDALTGTRLAATEPLELAGDWTTLKVSFTVPMTSDGIVVRFIREGCGVAACPVQGKISFDDLSIRKL